MSNSDIEPLIDYYTDSLSGLLNSKTVSVGVINIKTLFLSSKCLTGLIQPFLDARRLQPIELQAKRRFLTAL